MDFTEKGRLVFDSITEKGRVVVGEISEKGSIVFLGTTTPVQPPLVVIHSISKLKISNAVGMDKCVAEFSFDKDIIEFVVRVLGVSYDTGTVAHEHIGYIPAGAIVEAEVDSTELYQEGANRINIYGRDSSGNWTLYQ